MNYKVLYRKYRPKTFDEIVGQEVSIQLLKESILQKKISHAYIFSGPRGTGKTSTAKIFAKAINCTANERSVPCGECDNCLSFAFSSDVYEIDAASNNGVDQIREIIDNIKLAPISSRYKVYIIDEVHMLSTSAFNALLLTLEEPPKHVVFILATTNIEDVPITVLSRCQRLDFKKIKNKNIIQCLKDVCDKEKIEITEDALLEIAEYSDGGMRDALSLLDQLSKTKDKITLDLVLDAVGLISTKMVNELLDDVDNNNVNGILNFVKLARENNTDYKTLIKKMINCIKYRAINIKIGSKKTRLLYEDYKNMVFELSNTLYKCNVHIDSYSMLEIILLDFVNVSLDKQTSLINDSKNNDLSIQEKPKENLISKFNDKLTKIRINNCFVAANKAILNESKEMWKKFVIDNNFNKHKKYLNDTSCVLASNDIMVIKCDFQEIVDNINNNLEALEESYEKYSSNKIKLIATTTENWDLEMEEYKKNLKNKVKYSFIDEEKALNEQESVDDIFKSIKIEVK